MTEPSESTTAAPGGTATPSADTSTVPPPPCPPDNTGNRVVWLMGLLVVILVLALMIGFIGAFRHWFALHTGTLHGGPDVYYNFWSGFGSDLGEATLISAVCVGVYAGVRKVNCHTKGCWRIGHHPLEGTPYILCRHHHPYVPNHGATHEHILLQHHNYKLQRRPRRPEVLASSACTAEESYSVCPAVLKGSADRPCRRRESAAEGELSRPTWRCSRASGLMLSVRRRTDVKGGIP